MKSILFALIILGASKVRGEGVELHLSSSSSPGDVITSLGPDTTSFHLVFTNRTKETYYVLKPINIAGFSCYRLEIKNKDGENRFLHPRMISNETTGSAPEPLEIGSGKVGVIEMFLSPQAHAHNWNYAHTWGFTGFRADDTAFIISYSLTSDSEHRWLSRYKLKGKAKLDISSKPLSIGSRQGRTGKAEQGGACQPATAPE